MEAKTLDERSLLKIKAENRRKIEEFRKKRVLLKNRTRLRFFVVSGALIFGALLYLYLQSKAEVDALQKVALSLKAEKKTLEAEKLDLISKLDEEKASSKIKEEAQYKLGMDYPSEGQIVYITVEEMQENKSKRTSDLLKALISNGL